MKMNADMLNDYNRRLQAVTDKFNAFQIEMIEKVSDAKEASLRVLLTDGINPDTIESNPG